MSARLSLVFKDNLHTSLGLLQFLKLIQRYIFKTLCIQLFLLLIGILSSPIFCSFYECLSIAQSMLHIIWSSHKDTYERLTLCRISIPFHIPPIMAKVESYDFSTADGEMGSLRN